MSNNVSAKIAKKIGLIGSISLMIGAVIGIGIFFKNDSVFKNNGQNGIGVLISWILASIIAFCTAFSFAEIGFGKRAGAGLAGSMEAMYGNKAGRFINFNQNFFYFGVLNLSIALFTAESIFNLVPGLTEKVHAGYLFLLAFALIAIFLVFNYFSVKWSTRFQVLATALKFVPLIAVAIAGIYSGVVNPDNSLLSPNKLNQTSSSLSFQNIIVALPGILFAYDSFLCFGTIKKEMKDERKQVPLTVIIGMVIVIVFYLLVSVGQILAGTGIANNLFEELFKNNPTAKIASTAILNTFILISIVGVLNSLILTGLRTFQQATVSRLYYGYWWLEKIYQKNKDNNLCGLIVASFTYLFWFIILLIPSTIMNTDVYIDGISNFPTLFMFGIYGTVVLKGLINRGQKKEPERKMFGFWVTGIISTIGCYLVFGYLFFYEYTFSLITQYDQKLNWGLFLDHGVVVYKWQAALWFISCLMFFMVAPFINDLLIKKHYLQKNKKLEINDNKIDSIIIEQKEIEEVEFINYELLNQTQRNFVLKELIV